MEAGYPPEGYLMMEYIDGIYLELIEEPDEITQIAEILSIHT
jgi:hypothetical protein